MDEAVAVIDRRPGVSPGSPAGVFISAAWVAGKLLERDDFSSKRHPALAFCLSMIFSENRLPLFRIMLGAARLVTGLERSGNHSYHRGSGFGGFRCSPMRRSGRRSIVWRSKPVCRLPDSRAAPGL